MILRRSAEPDAGIDMTPMIDCVFLLLIFFMCTATMSKVDMAAAVVLPVAPKAAIPEDLKGRGVINILPMGSLSAEGPTTEARPFLVYGRLMDEKSLTAMMNERLTEEPNLRIYLRVDHQADFRIVKRAIRACAAAGIYDIIFGTTQSEVYR